MGYSQVHHTADLSVHEFLGHLEHVGDVAQVEVIVSHNPLVAGPQVAHLIAERLVQRLSSYKIIVIHYIHARDTQVTVSRYQVSSSCVY